MSDPIRINKRMAELGLCSRREADALIEKGVVFVDDKPATMGQKVTPKTKIEVRDTSPRTLTYLAYYKGRGIITHSPAAHETDIVTRLKHDYGLEGLYPVGRLDKDSEGLLIVTNDGRLTAPLLNPESNIEKVYEVEVDKPVTGSLLQKLESGVNIEGYITKPAKTTKLSNKRLELTLTEGKKHQIRRMCAALGFQVQSLKRTQIANIELGTIKPNQYRKLIVDEQTKLFQLLNIG